MPRPHRSGGFTLLELLVVLVILAVMAATAVLSVGTLGKDDQIEREARRLIALLQLAAEESLFHGRDVGLYVEEDRYRFYAYSRDALLWESLGGDPTFRERHLPEGLVLSLRVEEQDVDLTPAESENEITPQVIIFGSGEMMPFELLIERQYSDVRFLIQGRADGTLELSDGDQDAI